MKLCPGIPETTDTDEVISIYTTKASDVDRTMYSYTKVTYTGRALIHVPERSQTQKRLNPCAP